MRSRISRVSAPLLILLVVILLSLFNAYRYVSAWTGPSAGPPNSNVSAPINVGSTDQVKNANIAVNGLAVFGNTLVASSTYLDWGSTAGASGYGIRDNNGTLEFKNYLGSWSSLQSTVSGLVGTATWATTGSNIANANAGNVGIGTGATVPNGKLTITNNVASGFLDAYSEYQELLWDGGTAANSYGTGIKSNTIVFNSAAGAYSFDKGGSTTTLSSDTSGNWAIGTTPSATYKLWVTGQVNAAAAGGTGGYVSTGNYGGTGSAAYFPSGIWSNASSAWIYGQININGAILDTTNRMKLDPGGTSWFNGGSVAIGGTSATHKLQVTAPASTGVHAIYGVTGINDSATYGVYGASNNGYYGALGRGDGYSFVGHGVLYNDSAANATAFTYISDRRMKKNIEPLDIGLVTLMKLKPVSFTWRDDAPLAGQDDIGLIAQDVEKVLPGLVHTDPKGMRSVDYVRVTPILIKSIQEQQKQIDDLRAELNSLKAAVAKGK